MLVGATGSGKSTLVDGIANYIMGVNFEDDFRFKMVTLEENEKNKNEVVCRCIDMHDLFILDLINTPQYNTEI